jgi:hypothetical protein
MNIGMLWFDNDPKVNLDTKIERAALYYAKKYGKNPTLCFVHPSMLVNTASIAASKNERPENGGASSPGPVKSISTFGIEVRSNRSVLPNHFWIGVNGASETPTAA